MAVARKHHFLTQAYLKGFASDRKKPKLFVVDLSSKKTFTTSPENVAAIRDFNRVDIAGVAIDQLEKDYAKFEGALAPALARCIERDNFADADDRGIILQFIALIAFRNPRMRALREAGIQQVFRLLMGMLVESEERYNAQMARMKADGALRDPNKEISYAEMRDFVERGQFDIVLNPMAQIGAELFVLPRMTQLISARKWSRIRATASRPFVTCDHPVSLWWSDPKRRGSLYPPGFGLTGTEVVFPVSTSLALLGAFGGEERNVVATEEVAAAINGATIANGASQIFAETDGFKYVMRPGDSIRNGSELLKDDAFLAARAAAKRDETR